MSNLGYLIKEGFKNIFNNRMMSLASIGVLISCLVLTGSAVMLSVNVSNIVDEVGESNVTTVYLADEMDENAARDKGRELRALPNITKVDFVDKEDAIQDWRETLGEDVFQYMIGDNNRLPYAYKVTIQDLNKYDDTIKEIEALGGVQRVYSHYNVVQKLTSLSSLITMMSFWIILALGVISLFIISNTIRMTMFSHRFEISIMKSVGASNHFVRIPFIVEGIVIGLVSAAVSVGLMYLLSEALIKAAAYILPFNYTHFTSMMWYIIGGFLAAGVLVGALGSWVSIRRFLKREGNEILGW